MNPTSGLATRLLLLAVLATVTLGQSHARADDDPFARGIDPIPFKLSSGESHLTMARARALPAGRYQVDFGLDGGFGLLGLWSGDEKVGDLIRRRVDLHLLAAVGLPGRLELGVDLPVTLHQRHGFQLFDEHGGPALPPPGSRGTGDVGLVAKLGLLDAGAARTASPFATEAFRLALVAEVRLPTGADQSFLGERGFTVAPSVVLDWDAPAGFDLSATLGYRWRQATGRFLNLHVGDELHGGLAAARDLPALPAVERWQAVGELLVATPARAPFAVRSPAYKTPLEALVGVRAFLPRGVVVRLAGGTGLGAESGYGRSAFRVIGTAGFAWPVQPSPSSSPAPRPPRPEPEPIGEVPVGPPWAVYEGGGIQLRGAVRFDLDRDTLQPHSLPVLDDVAAILKAQPEIRRVRIDGHTDSLGSAAYNRELSRRRAQSVVQYLISQGVEAERLSSQGFGQERPIDSNATEQGRARNRRVEVTILEVAAP